jgi:hypothetical protein
MANVRSGVGLFLYVRIVRLQPRLLTADPSLSGQPATIRVPHISGVDPPAT